MNETKLYRLSPIDPLASTGDLQIETGQTYEVVEFEPSGNKRYVVSVEVGDLPPNEVGKHLLAVKRTVSLWLGAETSNVLFVPCRNGHPALQIYELAPTDK